MIHNSQIIVTQHRQFIATNHQLPPGIFLGGDLPVFLGYLYIIFCYVLILALDFYIQLLNMPLQSYQLVTSCIYGGNSTPHVQVLTTNCLLEFSLAATSFSRSWFWCSLAQPSACSSPTRLCSKSHQLCHSMILCWFYRGAHNSVKSRTPHDEISEIFSFSYSLIFMSI